MENGKKTPHVENVGWNKAISGWRKFNPSPPIAAYASVNWGSIGSDNGLLPIRRQAIIWTNDGLLSIGPLKANFSEI